MKLLWCDLRYDLDMHFLPRDTFSLSHPNILGWSSRERMLPGNEGLQRREAYL